MHVSMGCGDDHPCLTMSGSDEKVSESPGFDEESVCDSLKMLRDIH